MILLSAVSSSDLINLACDVLFVAIDISEYIRALPHIPDETGSKRTGT